MSFESTGGNSVWLLLKYFSRAYVRLKNNIIYTVLRHYYYLNYFIVSLSVFNCYSLGTSIVVYP